MEYPATNIDINRVLSAIKVLRRDVSPYKKITKDEYNKILDCICVYDDRNPDYKALGFAEDNIQRPDPCYCDNCHRGLHDLAEIALKLLLSNPPE